MVLVGAFQIFCPITYIINLSIKQRTLPDNLKIAKVIPIFKQVSRSLCDNYRPISVLPVLSKVFEKCIHNQLIFYFSSENITTPTQYGFKPGSTTVDCPVDLIEEISTSLDQGDYAVSIFLDLSFYFIRYCQSFDFIIKVIVLWHSKTSYRLVQIVS